MSRKPAITSLLNGQATKVRFGSISVTCSRASIRFSARAQLAPPNPPPITTTRAADWASEGDGRVSAAAHAAMPRTTFLRVIRRSAFMRQIQVVSGGREGRRLLSGEADVLVLQRHRTD